MAEGKGARTAAQALSACGRSPLLLFALVCLPALPARSARAQVGCAGDGAPRQPLEASALLSAQLVPLANYDEPPRGTLDFTHRGIALRTARMGVCGRLQIGSFALLYDFVVEPWDLTERARPDAESWGRFAAAEFGVAPVRWATLWLGVHKVAFSRAHDEPEQVMALPLRPTAVRSIAPDRRLGITLDDDFGAAHLVFGVYAARRDLLAGDHSGLLITDRLVAEPLGPVGQSISTVGDLPFWRRRPRIAINSSGLIERIDGQNGYAIGGDLGFKWGPVGAAIEYLYGARVSDQLPALEPAARLTQQGIWLELAVMALRPFVEVTARYEYRDAPHVALRGRAHSITAGVTLYAAGTHARLQLVGTANSYLNGGANDRALLCVITLAE